MHTNTIYSTSGVRVESRLLIMAFQHLLASAYLVAMRENPIEAAMSPKTVQTQRFLLPIFAVVVLVDGNISIDEMQRSRESRRFGPDGIDRSF